MVLWGESIPRLSHLSCWKEQSWVLTLWKWTAKQYIALILETKIDRSHPGSQNVGECMHLDTRDEDWPCQTIDLNVVIDLDNSFIINTGEFKGGAWGRGVDIHIHPWAWLGMSVHACVYMYWSLVLRKPSFIRHLCLLSLKLPFFFKLI